MGIFLICFFFLLLASTAGATEYTVRPSLSDEFGASVAGEEVQEIEVKLIPYWMFLLMLSIAQVSSAPEILFSMKLAPLLGGYKRTSRSNILDNLNREKLYDFIRSYPGTYFNEIVKRTGLNRGTVRYHVNVLEEQHMIITHKPEGRTHYFQNGSTYDEKDKTVIAALTNDTDRQIIQEILNDRCNTNGTLAKTIGISTPAMSWHIKRLMEQGIVKGDKKGRCATYNIDPDYSNPIEEYLHLFEI